MYTKIALIAGIVFSNIAFATESDKRASVSEQDHAVMIATAKDTWSMVAMNSSQGLTKVREFHEMGDSGVQQIDYVVNCSDRTLALASFAVLTSTGRIPASVVEPSFSELSFYKPVISHDQNIANNVCENRVASNGMTRSE
jgi:hypothetical protein